MSFEDFQDGRHGSHLGYRNGMILAILNLPVVPMPPIKFGLNLTCVREQMWCQNFQDCRLGQLNGMTLEILNLYVALILPIKFRLNPTYSLEGDVI